MENGTKKQKLLLVDDNELTRIYFREVFWLHGLEYKFDLLMAETFEQAYDILKDHTLHPDIIFLGLVMPAKIDGHIVTSPDAGFNFLKYIKSNPQLRSARVVIFSAFDNAEYKKTAKELGADAYLVKGENLPQDIIQFVQANLTSYAS
jgi:CheY-like chemotaxis protein